MAVVTDKPHLVDLASACTEAPTPQIEAASEPRDESEKPPVTESEARPGLVLGKDSKKEKKEKKKEKKDKEKKDKKAKKEKKCQPEPSTEVQSREAKKQATPEVALVAAQLDTSSNSSTSDIEQITELPPSQDHKTRLCSAFLEGRCHKGSSCPAAHSQSELRKPGEAAEAFRRQARLRAVRDTEGASQPHQVGAWAARATRMAPQRPVTMGIPHIMDPLLMGHPGIMTLPLMSPEMMHGPHYHPMAMMVDPALMMPKEKPPKKKKERKEEKQKRKDEKISEASLAKPKEKRDSQTEKLKRKDKSKGAEKAPARKERKVDEEDL
ncbi:unnamed protein product [Symbiodinium pilosum]|uniref:C3H1-type domain-containing protein n=1 Tax=Symbiodinium pilosum TaxID=2952 RepID=A0A812VIN6_SYMPI|nr:unnamed protein product [Symbiodinium pilosum]